MYIQDEQERADVLKIHLWIYFQFLGTMVSRLRGFALPIWSADHSCFPLLIETYTLKRTIRDHGKSGMAVEWRIPSSLLNEALLVESNQITVVRLALHEQLALAESQAIMITRLAVTSPIFVIALQACYCYIE